MGSFASIVPFVFWYGAKIAQILLIGAKVLHFFGQDVRPFALALRKSELSEFRKAAPAHASHAHARELTPVAYLYYFSKIKRKLK
jgi:hypothetical protein